MQMGNGLWESATFNTRLQMTQAGLGTSAVDTSKWKLTNDYGTTNNNGNVRSQTMSAPGLLLTETYTYDAVNRLTHASETNASNVGQWQQGFIYDRYGNRQINLATTSAAMIGENPTISTADNRITGDNYAYDGAGNMTRDKNSTTLAYDAENHQTGYGQAGYAYDGDGKRIKKTWDGVTTIFVYDALGKLVAEYTNAAVQGEGGTSYLTQDHLGSTRVVTNSAGGVKARLDYLPFGEELTANVGGRDATQGYSGADNVRQKFTGHERDDETGLDYMKARYYSSWQGRFTSPDKPFADQHQTNPQSWNLYSYVRNNPCSNVDVNGRCSAPAGLKAGSVGICIEAFIATARLPGKAILGRGDNRTFSGDNENLTQKVRVDLIVTPLAGQNRHHIEGNTSVGTSRVTIPVLLPMALLEGPDITRIGTAKTTLTDANTTSGIAAFTVTTTATNGFPSLPTAPSEPIDFKLNLEVTPDEKVGIRGGSERDGYPSFGIYSYKYVDGKLVTTQIYT